MTRVGKADLADGGDEVQLPGSIPCPVGSDKERVVEPGKGHADATLLRLRLHHGLAFGHDLGQPIGEISAFF